MNGSRHVYKTAIFLASFLLSSINVITLASPIPRRASASKLSSFVPRGGSVVLENEATSNSTTTAMNETTAFSYTVPSISDSEKESNVDVDDNAGIVDRRALKVLFLSADTGGGHRASAESLANQLIKHYPGTEYDLVDVWTPTNIYPYKHIVRMYKHLSAHPRRWKALYYISNTRIYEKMTDIHSKYMCYEKVLKQLEQYDFDVVVSVHPTMNFLPEKAIREIAKKRGKYVPFFTVVTDFGSAHCTWFQGMVDKIYIASDRIKTLAKKRGRKLKEEQMVMSGLPIREDFAVHAEKMGDRTSEDGKKYRDEIKNKLGLTPEKKTILVMGGGEGVGSLRDITEKLYLELRNNGIDASICVVCGRNENLRSDLESTDWDAFASEQKPGKLKKMKNWYKSKVLRQSIDEKGSKVGNVNVLGLGFVTNMADYMVASDLLVSKAGPGTIAEAAAVGLPVMITSFLPGQEAGNVNIVLDAEFGAFEKKPKNIAKTLTSWLQNDSLIDEMSTRSAAAGNPNAASDIVKDIGEITLDIMGKNGRR